MLERIIRDGTSSLTLSGAPASPGLAALFNAGPKDVYLTFDDVRIFLVTARPRSVSPEARPLDTQKAQGRRNAACVARLRELVTETQFEVPGLNVGITGEPVLELDEMAQSQRDSTKASVAALILSALIFIYGYRETGRPVKATLCLIVGLGYTMAFTTATVGHLNILTITFVPILIGLAIDFGVHLVTRYEEEMRHGTSEEAALIKAMVFTGQGIFTGALTTAAAFWAMAITNFKGIQEMGVICGGGIMVCLMPMMTMLPALLLRGRQNVIEHTRHDPAWDRRARIEQLWLKRPILVLSMSAVVTVLAWGQFHKVDFDYNLLNMQSEGLPSVEFEKKLIRSASKSVIFAAVVASNSTHAAALESHLQEMQRRGDLQSVASVESISAFLTEDSSRKLALVGDIKRTIEPIHFVPTDVAPVQVEALGGSLWSLQGYLGSALEDLKDSEPAVSSKMAPLRDAIQEARRQMLAGDAAANGARLGLYQQALFNDIRGTFAALRDQDNSSGLRVQDLPDALRNRFVGVTGQQLLQVYPSKDVWKRENQLEFVSELRKALDPHETNQPIITGAPVQLLEYTTLLKESYQEAAWYALAAISIMVLLHFRSLSSVILALLPVALGSAWMGGVMGWCDIPFNPANIMTLPLVVGIGVTNGIHILNRYAEEWNPSILAKSTGKAVLVSGLTTIAGFGSLTLAKHQGIQSLGLVMSLGVGLCMLAGLTFLPALLSLRRPKEKPSADA
jgi:hopanoid biosynthesis associated RND transporter like protein HpnN